MTTTADLPRPLRARYEHVVSMSTDPAHGSGISRRQIWDGLVDTVRSPQDYDQTLSDVAVTFCHDGIWHRSYRRFGCEFKERATAHDEGLVTFVTLSPEDVRSSSLTISLEEPAPGFLCLRFVHELRGDGGTLSVAGQEAQCAAWNDDDLALVHRLRSAPLASRHAS